MKNFNFNFKSIVQSKARWLLTIIAILTLGVGQIWADNTIVVGVAGTNASNYTVKVEPTIGDGGKKWGPYELTKADFTFEGKKLYVGTMNEKYGGVDNLDIHYYSGNTWKSKKTPYTSWTNSSTFQNRIFNYDNADGKGSKYGDVSMTNGARVYFDASSWDETSIKLVTGHANHQKYYTLSAVTNTKLYYGTNGATWSDAMGFGIVGGTDRSGTQDQWLTDVSAHAAEYTGWKNYGLTATGTNQAYLVVPAGDSGEQPSIDYYGTAYSSLNKTQTIKYAVGVNGGTPATLTSGYVPADIAISSYKFSSGTYNSVSSSSGSVTLSQGGSNYSATVSAARTATTTYTVSNVHEDYSFLGWYDAASGGNLLSSELSYVHYPTSATTAYARFSKENNHTVTISRYCTSTSSEISSTSAKIGEVTYSSIEAPEIYGYTFVNWTLGSGVTKHSSDAVTSNPIRVITAASGDYTLTANYTEVLTTDWKLIGDNQTGSPFGDNYTYSSGKAMAKKSGYSANHDAYYNLNVTKLPGSYFGFKVATANSDSYKYGYGTDDSHYITFNRSASGSNNSVYNGSQNPLRFVPDGLGEYEFKVDYSDGYKVVVTFPTVYTVTYGKGTGGNTISASYSSTSFNSGTKVQSGKTVRFTQTALSGYQFKEWNTNSSGSGTRLSTSATYDHTVASSNTVYAIYDPKQYTITLNDQDATTAVSPATVNATYKSLTLSSSITNPEKTGYTFGGWYSAVGGGGYEVINTSGALQASKSGYTDATGWTKTSAATLYAKWTQVLTLDKNGGTTDGSLTVVYKKTATSAHTAATRTGYTLAGYYDATSGGNKIINADGSLVSYSGAVSAYISSSGAWIYNGTATLYAHWTANSYDVTLKPNGATTGSEQVVRATFDAAMPTTTKTSAALAAPTKTGYTLQGFYQNSDGTGTKYYNANMTSANNWDQASIANIWAKWQANNYTVTLDKQTSTTGYGGTAGTAANPSVTYDATVPAISGTAPTAANGYAFMGFYTEEAGEGVKVINSNLTWVASVDGYTDASSHWIHDGNVTLYAYFKKAEITGITFTDGAVVAPSTSKTVTAVIDPTPTGTATVCWRVLYSNDNPMDPQPSFSSVSGNSVSFTAPAASGMYKMEAVLHLGSGCGGEELSTYVAPFQVAGDHEVTVQYMCGGEAIKASETMIARPLDWSDDITAPDIFGYTFSRWVALDGVSIKDHANDTSTTATIQIKAVYDGKLKAEYTQNAMIYFKNTLGWSDVYVNFYSSSYWNNPNGSGNNGVTDQNKHMTQIDDTDIWYYDYGAESITPNLYVSFTSASQSNAENFWAKNPGINVVYPANYADDIHTNKSSENGFKAATPMFVPLAGQSAVVLNSVNSGKANYYNAGYWTKYTAGTGYTLEIYYDSDESSCIQSIPFTSEDDLMPMSAVVDLEASTTYRYQVRRGGTSSAGIYYGNTGTMTYANHGVGTGWIMENTMAGGFKKAKITTNASGNYTFNLSYSPNASNEYRLRMEVDYPIADKDYRLVYSDATQTKPIISAIVTKANNSKDTVSFFIRPGSTPVLKIQQATVTGAGAITWNDYSTISSYVDNAGVDALSKDSVYNICLTMDGSGAISVENVEAYTGNYYIRTNAAGASKWDNFRSADHLMTYSEYSEKNAGYSHYFMAYVGDGANVKFVVANDYAPNISDTLKQASGDASHVSASGDITEKANVRFMWNRHDNSIGRAYLAAAKSDGSEFLVLRANSSTDMMDENGNALIYSANSGQAGYNHKAPDNSIQFVDDENWIYETTVKVKPSSYVKLYAHYHEANIYYKGLDNSIFDGTVVDGTPNAIQLITGSGDAEKIRVIYDFKTDRLVAAWLPSGEIDEVREINADVMFIREHQGDIEQLTFTKGEGETMGAITEIKTAYAVLRFNKWTLNNKSKTGAHAVLDPGASRYERDMFYVSFPFRVSMNEVFGFGKYGQHWIVEEYDGASRAANGFWAETPTYWRFVTDRKGKFFEPNQGYIIALDLDELGETSSVWDNGVENVELYFPSYGTMGDITNATVMYNLPAHECTINRPTPDGDRRIKDSHWNVMPVPTYVNTSNVTFSNTTWTATRPSFLYEWNMNDNSLTPRSGSSYTYHAMHAYIVQYCGDVTWTSTSVTPSSIVARERTAPSEVEFRIELSENEQTIDQTYVRLSNDEEVSTGFVFGEDMSKEFNKSKANIYTFIGTEQVAGNVLPMSEQTTVVPVGVKIVANGDYTFSIPDGTEGTGVTLIDNETGVHTNLALMDYTVALEAGTYDGRFILEISPITQTPTGVDTISDEGLEMKGARKVIIDEKMYILKDGKVYDARGARVQ